MSKNTQISELINYLSVDGSGNIVITGSLIGPAGATYATQSYVSTNYLGLSGGTLTGALNATTISTSGSATFGSDVFTYNNGGIFFSGGNLYSTGVFQNSNGLNLQVSGSPVLKLAYTTGAATFTGSIYLINANTRISSDGNGEVGINYGTITTSSYTFSLYNNTTRTVGFTAAGAATFSSYLTANGYYVPNTAEQGFATLNGSNGMLVNGTSGYVVLMSGGNETMFLNSAGRIGIGTTTPTGKLHVVLPAFTNEDTDSQQAIFGSGTSGYGIRIGYNESNNSGYIYSLKPAVAWGDIKFAARDLIFCGGGSTEAMRINSVRDVGIGTSTPSGGISGTERTLEISNTNVAVLALTSLAGAGKKHQIYSSNDGGLYFRDGTAGQQRFCMTSAGNMGIATTSPSHRLQVSGNIYSTDTVFGRNIKPEAFASVSAGSPTGSGIPLGYSTMDISSLCDNNWRTILSNINDTKVFMWVTLGDAASKDTASYTWQMTSPAYGVANFGQISYLDGGWNTGGFEFVSSNANGTYNLMVRCTSYYSSGYTAYGTIYFLRLA